MISKFSKGFRYLLCVIEIYSKHAWVIPLKDKKGITITSAFQDILDESNCKPNKTWAGQSSEFHNKSTKSFLQNNNIEMYSAHNEGNSVVSGRSIRSSKKKIYKYTTSIPKNVYTDKLDDIVNKYHTAYHSTTKMNSVDVKSNIYIDSTKDLWARSWAQNKWYF